MPCDRCDSQDAKMTVLTIGNDMSYLCSMCARCRLFYNGKEAPEHPISEEFILLDENRNMFPKTTKDETVTAAVRWIYNNLRHHLETLHNLKQYPLTNATEITNKQKDILKAIPTFKSTFPQFKQPNVNFKTCCSIVMNFLND